MNRLNLYTNSPEETKIIGEKIGSCILDSAIVALYGELGAGKTQLVKGIARGFGSHDRVTSPTYTLINEYQRTSDHTTLYHLDCYRVDRLSDAISIGVEEILDEQHFVVIEWASRIESLLPEDHLSIQLIVGKDDARTLVLNSYGQHSADLLTHIKAVL